jgi:hypothetical protein
MELHMNRETLPTRRQCVTFLTDWQGHRITVTIGKYADPEKPWLPDAPGDVFADLTKDGPLAAILDDAACAISIALQYGAPPDVLAKSMGQVPVSEWDAATQAMIEVLRPASPIGAIVNAIVQEVG